jgi:hypothetical protein
MITSRITKIERDIGHSKVTKDFEACAKLHGEQHKLMKDLNGLKKKFSNLQKKEIKHQKYLEKRSSENQSKTSSSECEDILQKDIRFYMRKQDNESSDSQLQTCHRPASDDTVLLTSDEDESMSTNEEESKSTNEEDRAEGQMYIEEKIHPVNTEINYGPNQNEAEDDNYVIGEDERKKVKLSENTNLPSQKREDSKSEEDREVEEIFSLTQTEPMNTNIIAEEKKNVEFKEVDMEKAPFL